MFQHSHTDLYFLSKFGRVIQCRSGLILSNKNAVLKSGIRNCIFVIDIASMIMHIKITKYDIIIT
jgi:hypothetical protein